MFCLFVCLHSLLSGPYVAGCIGYEISLSTEEDVLSEQLSELDESVGPCIQRGAAERAQQCH